MKNREKNEAKIRSLIKFGDEYVPFIRNQLKINQI